MSTGPDRSLLTEPLLSIVRETEYDEQAQAISKTWERLDELDSAIDWAVARFKRNPEVFYSLGEDKYLYKTERILGFPQLRILFSVDELLNKVSLISIEELVEEDN